MPIVTTTIASVIIMTVPVIMIVTMTVCVVLVVVTPKYAAMIVRSSRVITRVFGVADTRLTKESSYTLKKASTILFAALWCLAYIEAWILRTKESCRKVAIPWIITSVLTWLLIISERLSCLIPIS